MSEARNYRHEGIILAAGGILCRRVEDGNEILIVHRKRYNDWTLPKGKLQDGESFNAAALRKVKEETGCVAVIDEYLGAIDYIVNGKPKAVFLWRMALVVPGEIADHEKVAEVVWMSPARAVECLTHLNEKMFIQTTFGRKYQPPEGLDIPPPKNWSRFWPQRSDHARLQREFDSFRIELALLESRSLQSDTSWASAARGQLARVEHYLDTRNKNVEGGWVCLHAARRCAMYALTPDELGLQASMLRAEAGKFSSWRAEEIKKQLAEDKQLTASRVINAMTLRDEYSSNQYQKIWLLGDQLAILLLTCASGLLLLVPLVTFFSRYPGAAITSGSEHAIAEWGYEMVTAVLFFGLLGAAFSAALSLINTTGRINIPERVANGYVTLARALFGAGVGLAGYALYRSRILDLHVGNTSGDTGPAAAFAVAFLFGFGGERLIARVLGKLSGNKT